MPGWTNYVPIIHTYPVGDLKSHDTGVGAECECKPRTEKYEDGSIQIIHSAFDGRELVEQSGVQ